MANEVQNQQYDRDTMMRNEIRRELEKEAWEKEREKVEEEKKQLNEKIRNREIIIVELIIIIIILLLLLLLKGCNSKCTCTFQCEDGVPSSVALVDTNDNDDNDKDKNKQSEQLYVTMPIITDMTNDVVLYCPQENENLFEISYVFLDPDTGKELYATPYIQAGDTIPVKFSTFLNKGEHKVKVSIKSRYIDTGKAANGTGSIVTITVK